MNARSEKSFHTGHYPSDHWAMQPCLLSDPKVICLAYFKNFEYAVYLNPTDKRGYRCIARLICKGDMQSTFNRNYQTLEKIGFGLLMQLMTDVYSEIVPIAQSAVAGNNSHEFDVETGVSKIGKVEEPWFLHGHIFGRGNPKSEYVAGVPLDGPVPGYCFDMMAKTLSEEGNDAKVLWREGEIEKVVSALKLRIIDVKDPYEEQGLRIQCANEESWAVVNK